MWEDESSRRDACGHDGVREGDGGLQLDQGDVVAVEEAHILRFVANLQLLAAVWPLLFLPDEHGVPFLVHDDVRGAHEHGAVLHLLQVVLSHGHSVLPAAAAYSQRRE